MRAKSIIPEHNPSFDHFHSCFFMLYSTWIFMFFSKLIMHISKEKSKGEQEALCQIYYIRIITAIVIVLCGPNRDAEQRMELQRQL